MTQSHPPAERRHRRSIPRRCDSNMTVPRTRATRATRSHRRCSPTASISWDAASNITGHGASSAPVPRSRMRSCSSRAARAPSRTCARRRSSSTMVSSQPARTAGRRCASTSARSTTRSRRLFPAGFYYKTFMWPPTPKWWLRYEHLIRRAAGMGRAAHEPDPDHYEHQYAHCDVLVIGGGAAGLAAARAAAHSGARVIICDERATWGGGRPDPTRRSMAARLATGWRKRRRYSQAQPNVRALTRTTAFGYYDGNLVGAIERVTDHLPPPPPHVPRQRLWLIRARSVILASGAHRARHRLCRQRPAGDDAGRRGARISRALRRAAGDSRSRLHEQ